MPFKVHPHMLRHATGYALANKGTDTRTLQAYLGHRSIQSTVRYTELGAGPLQEPMAMTPASVSAQRCAKGADDLGPCPLHPRKWTCATQLRMSAKGQKRTFAPAGNSHRPDFRRTQQHGAG
jgi:Phage integrase family